MAVRVVACVGVRVEGDPQPLAAAPVVVRAERRHGKSGWIARILEEKPDAPGGLVREFLRAVDEDLSRAGNGMVTFEIVTPGVYEVEYVTRGMRRARTYFSVTADGTVAIIGTQLVGLARDTELRKGIAMALANVGQAENGVKS